MKVSLILEAVNRVTAPMRAAIASVEGLQRIATTVSAKVSASFGRIGASATAVRGRVMAMNDFVVDAGHHFRKMAGEEGMARASRSAAYLREQVSGLTTGLSILKYATVGAMIGLGEEFVRGVFTAGGESQRMLVTLTRLEGSATKAKRAMSWMTSFGMGAGAAFSMPDIMRSYQQAKNFGMDPQGGSLATFADLAAGERVPLKQVLLAVKDAMEGTSTRPLANLGIKMKQGHGEDAINTYLYSNLAGKFVTETSKKTPEATLATLVRIIAAKYGGLATAQAKTVPGGIEQIRKLIYNFEMNVANAGVLDWALTRMNQFFAWVRKASSDGTLDRLAKQISGFLTGTGDKFIAFVRSTNWAAVGRDVLTIAKAILAVAYAVGFIAKLGGGGLSGLFNLYLVAKIAGIVRALWGFRAVAVVVFEVVAAAIGAIGWPITLAIAGMIALYFAVRNHWGAISGFIKRTWSSVPGAIMAAWRPISAFFKGLWDRLPSPPAWMRAIGGLVSGAWNRVSGSLSTSAWAQMMQPAAPRAGPPRALNPAGVSSVHRVGGTMTVEFRNPPPGLKVTKLESAHPDFAIALKRGPVLASQ